MGAGVMSKPSVLSEAIRHAADPMVLMQRVADQALKLVHGADGAVIELLDDQDRLEYVAAAVGKAGGSLPVNGYWMTLHSQLSPPPPPPDALGVPM